MGRFVGPLVVIAASIMAFAVPWVVPLKFNDDGSRLQASFVGVLIVVTAYYAYQTRMQAEAAKEQAEASLRIAEEASQPMLDVRLETHKDMNQLIREGVFGGQKQFPRWVESQMVNLGTGPALDVEWLVQHPKLRFPERRVSHFLVSGKETQIFMVSDELRDREIKDDGALVAVYWDPFARRRFESRRDLRLNDESVLVEGPLKVRLIEEEKNDS